MIVFRYDRSFEGLLTCVFEAYTQKKFPDLLLSGNDSLPLFYDSVIEVVTDSTRSARVWKGLQKKLSKAGLSVLTMVWLSELPETDFLLFRYIQKAFSAPAPIELNFGDPDILRASQIARKVSHERERVIQFLRFQKTRDGIFFGALEPLYNVLPVAVSHFQDRFAGQKWVIYDIKRNYGYYYDLQHTIEICFDHPLFRLESGNLSPEQMDTQEQLFQRLWQEYYRSISIKERKNPKLHRQNLPARFWKYLTEKKDS